MIIRINSHKSVWINFNDTCESINREKSYVIIYVEKKLNVTTSINKNNELILYNKIILLLLKISFVNLLNHISNVILVNRLILMLVKIVK
jgi:translation initiation factor 2 beta subunit (eIF-2beta)/eIF-5